MWHAGYKNMQDTRTLYAIPNDVLITGIHCIYIKHKLKVSKILKNFRLLLTINLFLTIQLTIHRYEKLRVVDSWYSVGRIQDLKGGGATQVNLFEPYILK